VLFRSPQNPKTPIRKREMREFKCMFKFKV